MKNRKGRVFTTLSWASIQMHMLIIQLSSNKPSLEMKNWRDQQTSSRGNQEERRTHNQNKNSVSNFHFGGGCRPLAPQYPSGGPAAPCCFLHTHSHTQTCVLPPVPLSDHLMVANLVEKKHLRKQILPKRKKNTKEKAVLLPG